MTEPPESPRSRRRCRSYNAKVMLMRYSLRLITLKVLCAYYMLCNYLTLFIQRRYASVGYGAV